MRKLKFIYISLSILLLGACSSELDIPPSDNEVIQPDFQKISDIQAALNGAYSGLKSDRLYTSNAIALGEWTADNLKISAENVGFGAIIHEWDYTESDATLEGTWIGLYDVVRRANFVIQGVDNYVGEETDAAMRLQAEAKIIKALMLVEAHRLYGEPYRDGSEMSVVYVSDPNDIFQKNARLSTNELFGLVKADINSALPFLSAVDNVNFVSSDLAHGLLMKLAMMEEDWSGVVTSADNILNNTSVNLSTINNYDLMWGENDEDGEAIFKVALDSDDNQLGDLYFNDGVGPVFDPNDDIMSLYGSGDVRFGNFFLNDPTYGMIISKYLGPASNRGLHEAFVMRLSEVVLTKAEAHMELGQEQEALSMLDLLRSNRIAGFTSPSESGSQLMESIRLERRKELVYEGFRFSDLKRWNEPVIRDDCTSDECLLEAGDFKFTFAIPRAEIFANENIIQNPGY